MSQPVLYGAAAGVVPGIINFAVSRTVEGEMLAGYDGQLQRLAPSPLAKPVFHFCNQRIMPHHVANLGDPLAFAHALRQFPHADQVGRERLFDEQMATSLGGLERHRHVQVGGGRHHDAVGLGG